ncbi:MAG: ATP-binding protein [Solirubrobacterales bacterium]
MTPQIRELLADFRVVTILGARQVGKTTLVRSLAEELPNCRYQTLDAPAELAAALEDPATFVSDPAETIIIDEVQRAPELLLAIKERVDRQNRRGQFLLTGSADLLNLKRVPDTLPGRNVYTRLFGLSQAEIAGIDVRRGESDETLIDRWFRSDTASAHEFEPGVASLLSALATGGFPDAQGRPKRALQALLDSYVTASVGREVDEIARVESKDGLRQMLVQIAARAGGTLNVTELGRAARVSQHTAERYTRLLRDMFLIEVLPSWSRNIDQRQTRLPKAYVADSGLHCALLGVDAAGLDPIREGPTIGSTFECFAINELRKLAALSINRPNAYHYRNRDGREIDLILERGNLDVVAIEIKSGAVVRGSDFRAIDYLSDRIGDQLRAGIVLYTGERTLSFGGRKAAVPVRALWA